MNDARDRRRARAVVLYSGGLDSSLAVEVLLRAGVEVIALQHRSVFYPGRDGAAAPRCELVTRDLSERMIELIRKPAYGFGKNANPCLDCKQMMYGLAWQEAQRRGADFIATGEVLGQRPMSQHRDAFRRMEAGAGVEGLVVRPLSGRLLPPTRAEQEGLIRREDLLDVNGRSRRRLMEMAARWGIKDYPTPAGGCKLTDPQFADRLFRLARMGRLDLPMVRAVRHGRLFELAANCLVLVGRNDDDNRRLLADAPDDALILELNGRPGPLACVVGTAPGSVLDEAKRLVIRYSRFGDLGTDAVATMPAQEARARPG